MGDDASRPWQANAITVAHAIGSLSPALSSIPVADPVPAGCPAYPCRRSLTTASFRRRTLDGLLCGALGRLGIAPLSLPQQ